MPTRYLIHLAELTIAILLAIAIYFSWRDDRRDRAQLNGDLVATNQLLTAADARQHDRDAQLAQPLAVLVAEKRSIVTPAQIVRDPPPQISLPSPIFPQSAPASPDSPAPKTNA